ncbi:hypothetical protein ACH4CC_14515 [Streptomyces lydicus]|uniref:hypothetical protein n=1 Tax=Streptomyces lydicus TaxID=47763 RepID=UPI003797E0AE
MSCPEPRYLGDNGAVSAAFRPADTPPELVRGANRTQEQVAEKARRGGQEFADFLVRHDSYFVEEEPDGTARG